MTTNHLPKAPLGIHIMPLDPDIVNCMEVNDFLRIHTNKGETGVVITVGSSPSGRSRRQGALVCQATRNGKPEVQRSWNAEAGGGEGAWRVWRRERRMLGTGKRREEGRKRRDGQRRKEEEGRTKNKEQGVEWEEGRGGEVGRRNKEEGWRRKRKNKEN